MALWGLLWFSNFLNIPKIHIYRDSKIIIDYVRGRAKLYQPTLQGWLQQITYLWNSHDDPLIQHIGRDFNQAADGLSKQGLQDKLDGMHIEIKMGDLCMDVGVLLLPG